MVNYFHYCGKQNQMSVNNNNSCYYYYYYYSVFPLYKKPLSDLTIILLMKTPETVA